MRHPQPTISELCAQLRNNSLRQPQATITVSDSIEPVLITVTARPLGGSAAMDLAGNTVRKRPVSGVVRKRPAAAAAEQPRPPPPAPVFTTPRHTSRLGYASDCSGLDCGSLALHKMGLPFDHLFASEVNPDYRAILSATHAVESVFPDITTRAEDSLRPFRGRVTIYTAGFPCQAYARQG